MSWRQANDFPTGKLQFLVSGKFKQWAIPQLTVSMKSSHQNIAKFFNVRESKQDKLGVWEGEWEKGRKGEREKGRKGEREKGRMGQFEK